MDSLELEILSTFADLDKDEYDIKKRITIRIVTKVIVIYHIPASTSYSDYDSSGNNIKIPIQQILNRTLANINTHGYAVISLAPEYFIQSNGSPQEILKEDEIKELAILIDSLLSKGISIHNFSKLAGIKTTIVENQTVNSIEKSNTESDL